MTHSYPPGQAQGTAGSATLPRGGSMVRAYSAAVTTVLPADRIKTIPPSGRSDLDTVTGIFRRSRTRPCCSPARTKVLLLTFYQGRLPVDGSRRATPGPSEGSTRKVRSLARSLSRSPSVFCLTNQNFLRLPPLTGGCPGSVRSHAQHFRFLLQSGSTPRAVTCPRRSAAAGGATRRTCPRPEAATKTRTTRRATAPGRGPSPRSSTKKRGAFPAAFSPYPFSSPDCVRFCLLPVL